jgi:hypothetical protein
MEVEQSARDRKPQSTSATVAGASSVSTESDVEYAGKVGGRDTTTLVADVDA